MPQSKAMLELKTFKTGLHTETTSINGSMASMTEMTDFRLDLDGSVEVREGLSLSAAQSLNFNAGTSSFGFENSYLWESPTGGSNSIVVFNAGSLLNFFEITTSAGVPVLTPVPTNLNSLPIQDQDDIKSVQHSSAQFATVGGDLIVGGHRHCYKYYIDTDNPSPLIKIVVFKVEVNDVFGIDDTTSVENPSTWYGNVDPVSTLPGQDAYITTRHNYNSLNQGFKEEDIKSFGSTTAYATPQNWSLYPSGVAGDFTFNTTVQKQSDKVTINTRAPRGSSKVELVWRGASRKAFLALNATELADNDYSDEVAWNSAYIPEDRHFRSYTDTSVDGSGDSGWLTASHSGRAWYSYRKPLPFDLETTAPQMGAIVAFSKSVTEDGKEGQCTTQNDPAGVISDVIDSDGGFIVIEGARTIRAMESFQGHLLVFAEEGVWAVSSEGLFSATNYDVRKITDSGMLQAINAEEMITSLSSSIAYWSKEGIEIIQADSQTGRLNIANITRPTIDRKYFQYIGRELLASSFDANVAVAKWLTKDTTTGEYHELLFNTATSSFYEYNLTELMDIVPDTYLVGYAKLDDGTSQEGKQAYVVVTGHFNAEVLIYDDLQLAYFDGTTAAKEAVLLTNPDTFGDASKRKNAAQLTVYMEQTEQTQTETALEDQSSCLVQTRWDFADSISSNKFGQEFEAYRLRRFPASATTTFDYGHDTVVTRNKIRGRGRALAIRFRSQVGKKCHLYGFSLDVSANSVT